jgi:hypothetical protein
VVPCGRCKVRMSLHHQPLEGRFFFLNFGCTTGEKEHCFGQGFRGHDFFFFFFFFFFPLWESHDRLVANILARFERALSPQRSLGAHKWNLIDHRCFMSNFTKCWNTSIGAQRPPSPEPFAHRMAFTLNKTGPAVVRPFSHGSIMRYTTSCCKSGPATIFDCWILLHPRCGCSIGQAFHARRCAALLAFPRGPHSLMASFSTTSPSMSKQLSHGPSETHQAGESL